jgi:hypothetical protein
MLIDNAARGMHAALSVAPSASDSAGATDTCAYAGDVEARLESHHRCRLLAKRLPDAPMSTSYVSSGEVLTRDALELLATKLWGSGVHVCAVCSSFTLSAFHDVKGTLGLVSKRTWQDAETVARERPRL